MADPEDAETMITAAIALDSSSVGDPSRFLSFGHLQQGLDSLPLPLRDGGRVAFVMRRGSGGRREIPDCLQLVTDEGVIGDAWGRRPERDPQMQIAVMQADVASLIANGQPLALFGDSLHLNLDLSTANLPPGSRLRVGGAVLEVTPAPHNGCRKFHARFGPDALRLVSTQALRHRNLRGIYMRVVEPGDVRCDDPVEVLVRALVTAPRVDIEEKA